MSSCSRSARRVSRHGRVCVSNAAFLALSSVEWRSTQSLPCLLLPRYLTQLAGRFLARPCTAGSLELALVLRHAWRRTTGRGRRILAPETRQDAKAFTYERGGGVHQRARLSSVFYDSGVTYCIPVSHARPALRPSQQVDRPSARHAKRLSAEITSQRAGENETLGEIFADAVA